MPNVSFNHQQIDALGKKVKSHAAEYKAETDRVYSQMERLQSAWTGADSEGYAHKLMDHKPTVQKLNEVLNNYGMFLEKAAKTMEQAQMAIKQAADKL